MKEKLFKKGITRRLFSAGLAVAMVLSLVSLRNITAHAREAKTYEINADIDTMAGPATFMGWNDNNLATARDNALGGDTLAIKGHAAVEITYTLLGGDTTWNSAGGKIKGDVNFTIPNGYKIAYIFPTGPNLEINLEKIPVDSVKLDTIFLTLSVGETKKLKAEVTPDYVLDTRVTWESSDKDAVTVDNNGEVRALAPGYSTITVKSVLDPTIYTTCSVNVKGDDNGAPTDTRGKVQVLPKDNFAKGDIVSTPDELKNLIILPEDDAMAFRDDVPLNVWTEIAKKEEGSVNSSEKQKITAKLPADHKVGVYLDIQLKAQLDQQGTRPVRTIEKTKGKVKLKIIVPTELQKAGRTYDIIRLHNGEATVLGAKLSTTGYELTFETDGFSTYALIYSDAAPAPKPSSASGVISAKTGESMPFALIMLAISMFGVVLFTRKRV